MSLVADRQSWARMGRIGRDMVEERFDAEKLGNSLEQTYLRLIKSYRSKSLRTQAV